MFHRLISSVAVLLSFLMVSLTGSEVAAKPFNEAQLRYIFEGTKFDARGGVCFVGTHVATPRFTIELRYGGKAAIEIFCDPGRRPWTANQRGSWEINGDKLCIESNGSQFNKILPNRDRCWTVEKGRFGLENMDRKGDTVWTIDITSHPKHPDNDELLAAVRNVKMPKVAEVPKAPSVSEAAADSADWEAIKYSDRISDFQRYLETHPNGLFVALADNQIRDLVKRQADPVAVQNEYADVDFGTYHALVIGINEYKYITKLGTAVRDAKAVSAVLRNDYNFKVQTLIDPDRADIVDAFDEYRETLTSNDNLLIYYAGHGWLDDAAEEGYWLSAKAKSNRRSQWVSNATITKTLKTLPAKHVMVVADSCYSGTLTRAAAVGFRDKEYFRRMARKKARVAMVSGGLEPVADDSGNGNSPFAKAFIDALSNNKSVIDGTRLFSQIRRPVILNAQQTPEYSDVRNANHDGGDFLFVRTR
jgi:hypothetical protein